MARLARIFFLVCVTFGQLAFAQSSALSCPEYVFEKSEFSFKNFNPAPEVLSQISFPGINKTLYRGAYESNPQFSLEIAIAGLFDQKNWHVGSPVFFGIKQILTGKWNLESDFFPTGNLPYRMRDYLEARKVLADVEILLKCSGNRTFDSQTAEVYSADLMNKVFKRMTSLQVENRYFNILDDSYKSQPVQKLGFGNNAADLIISSTYDLIAALYGSKILVLEDKRNRALDLGFYNYKKNALFFQQWVDNGEVNSPGYIKSDELIGYQQRKMDRLRTDWAQKIPDSQIDFALYKTKFDNETVILVLDGEDKLCINQATDKRYYACHNYWKDLMTQPSPYPTPNLSDKIRLLGVITTCSSGQDCPIFEKVNKWYGKWSTRSLDSSWIKRIESVQVNGKSISYRPAKVIQVLPPKITVLSASYLTDIEKAVGQTGNVTIPAAQYLNGKIQEDYKISSRFLGTQGASIPRSFEIEWSCSDENSTRHKKTVSAPAENRKLQISCLVPAE